MTNLVPFGQHGERLYAVAEVARGIACECVCPDPQCGHPLVARKGDDRVWHFAHAGDREGSPCSGRESGLHKYAKQVLCEAISRVVHLPYKSNKEFYKGHFGMLRVSSATAEARIPGTSRRCDVLLAGKVRLAEGPPIWKGQMQIAVEIAVTHHKDEEYRDDVKEAGRISVLEVPLSWKQVQEEAERLSKQHHEVVRHILLNQCSKHWIFKRGGEAWVCSGCRGYKRRRDRTMCDGCLAQLSTRVLH